MQIQYVIINFIILITILVIAGRKTVKRIFGGRLENINKELDEAEMMEKMEMPVFMPLPEEVVEEDLSEEILKAKVNVDEKIGSIKAFGEREFSEIHRGMIENARKELFSVMRENVIKLFSYEKYAEEIKALDGQVLDAILSQISLTNGDMAYLYRRFFENSLMLSQLKADILRFESANDRYARLQQDFPEITKRAPLTMIASYLQMTLETLSRVRASIANAESK